MIYEVHGGDMHIQENKSLSTLISTLSKVTGSVVRLPALPYNYDALEPYISSDTLKLHYKRHHKSYVDKLNELVVGTKYANLSLEQIILTSSREPVLETVKKIFNNANQIWNHTFFWNCMSREHGQQPSKLMSQILIENFSSVEKFMNEFEKSCIELFGSGWVWLVKNRNDKLEIFKSDNSVSPLVFGMTPLLACDVWEHAYYLDYKNDRKAYVQRFWNLVNWSFVEQNMTKN